ncbi:hypothetical protein CERSUDRAFT_92495 [Gelatoporia subvermispora B]|uniref:Protein-S-isoprenylcysteine O-methyltransferase n=1 Tax=Ceriporiopsis subvermispora (strain B) TaxID=914234 RepID=M2PTH9_CERS8|nr:hypothetical protein CERSUDRAFT_92495 [Gelatoporia subvermispora B]
MDPVTKMIQMGATRVMDLGVASAAICEIVTILTSHFPLLYTHSTSTELHLVNSGSSNIWLTNALLVATLLTVAGGIGRSLAIREEHSLVTDGPYAIVRHPSCLAYIVWAVGATAWMWASGSWVRECGVLDTWLGLGVVGAWTMIVLSVAALVFSRAKFIWKI